MDKQVSNPASGIGHNSGSARAQITQLAVSDIEIWEPAHEQASDLPKDKLALQIALIREVGQPRPLPARERADGRIEVVSSAHIVCNVAHDSSRTSYEQLRPRCCPGAPRKAA